MDIVKSALQLRHWCRRIYGKAYTTQLERIDEVIKSFNRQYDTNGCCVCSSSGRVEIVGNHTDHNGGKVMACTVDRDILAGFLPRDDGKIVIKSHGYSDIVFDITELDIKEVNSRGMAKGVLKGLQNLGYNIGGMIVYMTSNVPSGAGMSSSASFQLLIGKMQSYLYSNNSVDQETLARIGQWAENNYFDKPCGLMDQATISVGGVVCMQFGDTFSYNTVPYCVEGYELVVVNTGGSHANLTEHYASIPQEMFAVAQYLGVDILGNACEQKFWEEYDNIVATLGVRPALRARHFFEENKLVASAVQAMNTGNGHAVCDILNASGYSSRYHLQNVSYQGGDNILADALDYSATLLQGLGCTRVQGGGFAGTIMSLVPIHLLGYYYDNMSLRYGIDNVHKLKIREVGTTVLTMEN